MQEVPKAQSLSDHLKPDEDGKIVIREELPRVKAALEKIPEGTLEQLAVHYKSKSYFDTTSHTARSQRRNKERIQGYGNKRSKKLKIDLHCQELKMVQALADTFGCSEAEAIRIAIHETQARMRGGQLRKLYSDPKSTKLNASESKLLWIAEKIEQGKWVEPSQRKAELINEYLDL
jgi:hypothetical protein